MSIKINLDELDTEIKKKNKYVVDDEPEEQIEHMSNNEISTIIETISEGVKRSSLDNDKKKEIFFDKYADFADKYPTLFDMCFDEKFDISKLRFMLDLRDRVNKKKLTQHDASVEVGKKLVDEFVRGKF